MASPTSPQPQGIELRGKAPNGADRILTTEALQFVADLSRRFAATREDLLARRQQRQLEIVDGRMPDFLPETKAIRQGSWRVTPSQPTSAIAASRSPVPWTGR